MRATPKRGCAPGVSEISGAEDGGKFAMNLKPETFASGLQRLIAVLCVLVIVPGDTMAELQSASTQKPASTASSAATPKIPSDQLDSLVAPIALFPDPMLAQTLAAATYPLEIIQLQ